MKAYEWHIERLLNRDLMLYGTSIRLERKKYNPLRYLLGKYKRLNPMKTYIGTK